MVCAASRQLFAMQLAGLADLFTLLNLFGFNPLFDFATKSQFIDKVTKLSVVLGLWCYRHALDSEEEKLACQNSRALV